MRGSASISSKGGSSLFENNWRDGPFRLAYGAVEFDATLLFETDKTGATLWFVILANDCSRMHPISINPICIGFGIYSFGHGRLDFETDRCVGRFRGCPCDTIATKVGLLALLAIVFRLRMASMDRRFPTARTKLRRPSPRVGGFF